MNNKSVISRQKVLKIHLSGLQKCLGKILNILKEIRALKLYIISKTRKAHGLIMGLYHFYAIQ